MTDHINHEEFNFWDEQGWQALCATCHNRKSQQEGQQARRKAKGGG